MGLTHGDGGDVSASWPDGLKQKTFGQFVKDERTLLKISRERLALDCGVNVETIANLENGRGSPHLGTILAIIETLGYRLLIDRADPGEIYCIEIVGR